MKLWELDIPLIQCRSIGFLGYLRIQVKEHTIVESHPDNEVRFEIGVRFEIKNQ